VPIAGITALQALRDKGMIRAGQKVLINGASGGVGTFAVQIAKNYGADVTGVCSTKNVEMVRSIGADHVIDYTRDDFTKGSVHYDLIIDNIGNHSMGEIRHVLNTKGALVIVGGPSDNNWIGPLTGLVEATIVSRFVSQKQVFMLADANKDDLDVLRDLMQTGKLTPVIDRRYKLSETPAAIAYLQQGHARGKVIINVDQ
jgi:NADPH:quinone reductase-like Zn-dependent oxidoreductase